METISRCWSHPLYGLWPRGFVASSGVLLHPHGVSNLVQAPITCTYWQASCHRWPLISQFGELVRIYSDREPCRLLARLRRAGRCVGCPLIGVDRKRLASSQTVANDPEPTCAKRNAYGVITFASEPVVNRVAALAMKRGRSFDHRLVERVTYFERNKKTSGSSIPQSAQTVPTLLILPLSGRLWNLVLCQLELLLPLFGLK